MKLRKFFITLFIFMSAFLCIALNVNSSAVSAASIPSLSPTKAQFKSARYFDNFSNDDPYCYMDMNIETKNTKFVIYKFIPAYDDYYDFYTVGSCDTVCKIYYSYKTDSDNIYKLTNTIDNCTRLRKVDVNCSTTCKCYRDNIYYFVLAAKGSGTHEFTACISLHNYVEFRGYSEIATWTSETYSINGVTYYDKVCYYNPEQAAMLYKIYKKLASETAVDFFVNGNYTVASMYATMLEKLNMSFDFFFDESLALIDNVLFCIDSLYMGSLIDNTTERVNYYFNVYSAIEEAAGCYLDENGLVDRWVPVEGVRIAYQVNVETGVGTVKNIGKHNSNYSLYSNPTDGNGKGTWTNVNDYSSWYNGVVGNENNSIGGDGTTNPKTDIKISKTISLAR